MKDGISDLRPEPGRRVFIKTIAAVLSGLTLPLRSRAADTAPPATAGTGLILGPDDGELLFIGPRRAPLRIQLGRHVGSERLAMGSEDIVPGDGIPVHKHGREDEIIFIHTGAGTVTLGEKRVEVKAGSTVFVPQGTWHGLENTGSELLKMIWIFSPAGFEQYFRDIGSRPEEAPLDRSADEWHQVDQKHAITYKR
jgi:mannose-6-phosphate isomerase-like protein (cupin superfamily)